MALRNLGRKLMGQALNKGSPSVVSAASLARPLSTLPFSLNNNRSTNNIHPLLSYSPKLAMALPQVRYASTKPESEDKAAATAAPASDKPATVSQKLKKMWEAYGVIAVGTYLSVYVTTLGSLFLALDYDVFNAATVGLDPTYAIHMVSATVFSIEGHLMMTLSCVVISFATSLKGSPVTRTSPSTFVRTLTVSCTSFTLPYLD